MSASLVGSEMCIRDRPVRRLHYHERSRPSCVYKTAHRAYQIAPETDYSCLLYTSDAADDM
eukprot:6349736-Alexandrium_andersonii.AAC.1